MMALKGYMHVIQRMGSVLLLVSLVFWLDRPAQAAVAPEDHIAGVLLRLVAETSQGTTPLTPFPGSDLLMLKNDGAAVAIRVTAEEVDRLLPALEASGFELLGRATEFHLVEGFFPVARIMELPRLSAQGLLGVLPVYRPVLDGGSVTSEADIVHEAARVRATAPGNYDGTGIEIGVMSDSFDNLAGAAADVASGDLPGSVTVVEDFPSGGSDEGRAMMQLAYDLAPGASYAFATAFNGEASFADNIRNLAGSGTGGIQANADIIVDDVVYLFEPFFQDGIIAQAVEDVFNNDGVAYFSSAGNRESRAYESTTFSASGDTVTGLGAIIAHDFDSGPGVDTRQRVSMSIGQQIRFVLQWDDPFYTASGVDTNLDIYLLRANNGTVVASSTDVNTSTQTPVEYLTYVHAGGPSDYDVVIRLTTGPEPGRIKYVNFGSDITISEFDTNSPTVNPHAATVGAQAVAAAFYGDHKNPESFSSYGPSTFLFDSSGTPLGSPEVRDTPDYTAVDGANNTFFGNDSEGDGFPNFFGTSAAAPHAAGLAALVLQANPGFTPSQMYGVLANSADDIASTGAGFDNVTGAGLLDVYEAINPIQKATARNSFIDGFESGVLSNVWETNTSGPSQIQVSSSNGPISGTYHLNMDAIFQWGDGLNEVILHLDLRNGSNIMLNFDQREWGDEDHPMPAGSFTGSTNADGVAMSVDGGNTWYTLISLTGSSSTSTYQTNTINLSQFATTNGLTLDQDVRIKFQQYDNFPIPSDGFGFDNIQVTSDTPTVIGLQRFGATESTASGHSIVPILLMGILLVLLTGISVYVGKRTNAKQRTEG